MLVNDGRLPHLLPPSAYFDPEWYAREIERLFLTGWQCVGTVADLPREGSFFTLDLYGRLPLQVRRHEGEILAFVNICAHRHCLLTRKERGTSPTLRCPYHGWEYDREGKPCRVRDGKSFRPIVAGAERLRMLPVEVLGKLIFVCLGEGAPELAEALGEDTLGFIRAGFGEPWRQVASWAIDHPANWKVVVENAIEPYHVSDVHRLTFGSSPEDHLYRHQLGATSTSFEDASSGRIALWRWLVRRFRREPIYHYLQHHSFPSLMFSYTDVVSLVMIVIPQSARRCRTLARVLLHRGEEGRRSRVLTRSLGRPAAWFVRRVLYEDWLLNRSLQEGLEASPHEGVLGACEERIFAFQSYLQETCGGSEPGRRRREAETERGKRVGESTFAPAG